MARGSKGEVTIKENKARGRWETRITVGADPVTGTQRRQLITGRTKAEVKAKLKAADRAMDEGRSPAVDKRTVRQFLERWLDEDLPRTVSPMTLANYRNVVKLYIVPAIGAKRVATLTPGDVSKMLQDMADAGKSANTQRLARSVLRRALRLAEQEGTVFRNVAAIADGVRVGAPEGRTLTVAQAKQLLDAVADDRMEAAYVVALTLGLRRGELLGLAWDDVDLEGDRPTITITKGLKRIPGAGLELSETKTRGSRRRIHLPAPAVAALRRHRKRIAEERLALGSAWPAKVLGADLVFRSPIGTACDPDNFRQDVYRLTQRTFTPEDERPKKRGDKWPTEYRWSPHELRHSAASLLIAQGVDLKIVSEVLGHSSIRITADVYGHLLDDAGLVAADAMTELLG